MPLTDRFLHWSIEICRTPLDQAHADRVADVREHDGHGAGRLLQCLNARGGRGKNHVRRERQKLLGKSVKATGVARCPAGVDPHVAAVSPARLLQPLDERDNARPPSASSSASLASASSKPKWEFPRLCRGGSKSLTYPGVDTPWSIDGTRMPSRRAHERESHRWMA
jgi:hypothetical protein